MHLMKNISFHTLTSKCKWAQKEKIYSNIRGGEATMHESRKINANLEKRKTIFLPDG